MTPAPQQDEFASGYSDRFFFRLARDMERGFQTFWNKRGGDPDGGGWRRRSIAGCRRRVMREDEEL